VDNTEPENSVSELWLVRLRDAEQVLRGATIRTIEPLLPATIVEQLQDLSQQADTVLDDLAAIDPATINDRALRPARIAIGLTFVGFSALMVMLLLLYFGNMHPKLGKYSWHTYIWVVCLGVSGMFMLTREAMRPPHQSK
jgi:hypothetical protein